MVFEYPHFHNAQKCNARQFSQDKYAIKNGKNGSNSNGVNFDITSAFECSPMAPFWLLTRVFILYVNIQKNIQTARILHHDGIHMYPKSLLQIQTGFWECMRATSMRHPGPISHVSLFAPGDPSDRGVTSDIWGERSEKLKTACIKRWIYTDIYREKGVWGKRTVKRKDKGAARVNSVFASLYWNVSRRK